MRRKGYKKGYEDAKKGKDCQCKQGFLDILNAFMPGQDEYEDSYRKGYESAKKKK